MHLEAMSEIATPTYQVRHYHVDAERIIVSFASRGFAGAGEPIEEFAGTLTRIGVSSVYVTDRHAHWWNHPDSEDIFRRLTEICAPYKHVGVIGESMGASGAILFTNYCTAVDRVLAFGPQYSICDPFIQFDARYRDMPNQIERFYFLDFAGSPIKERIQILFGNTEWQDYLHAAMFSCQGFGVHFVDGCAHDVAGFLKRAKDRNSLLPLIARFCDFTAPFGSAEILRELSELISTAPLQEGRATVWEETAQKQSGLAIS